MSIVESLIDQVAEEVTAAGTSGTVRRLDLSIGCLSGVHVDSLRFAFEVLAPGTLVDGAELAIRQPRAQASCRACGAEFETGEFLPVCVRCQSGRVTTEGGQDMVLESIELDEDD